MGSRNIFIENIHQAIKTGNVENLQSTLARDSKIRFLIDENNLLHVAACYGNHDIVSQLLENGASANILSTETARLPIHEACINGNVEVLKQLVSKTDDLNVQDRTGLTAVHISAINGEVECLRILANAGAKLDLPDRTHLQATHWAAKRDQPDILALLFDLGVDLETTCQRGCYPVHYAAQQGALNSLRCLVERSCDITLADKSGNQCIHLAAWHNQLDCLRFIVKQAISINVQGRFSRTPAHLAALHGSIDCLHWILEQGIDVNQQDEHGNTIGHSACEGGHVECYNCFLQHGGISSILNTKNETPHDTARRFGHPNSMEKAVLNDIVCPLCNQKKRRFAWELKHTPSPVLTSIKKANSSMYNSPLGAFESHMRKSASAHNRTKIKSQNSERLQTRQRDIVTQYYGKFVENS